LVNNNDNKIGNIYYEDTKVKEILTKDNKKINGKSKTSGMARFSGFMKYKSEESGIKFLLVPAYNTSQINCLTGKKFDSKV